MEGDLLKLYGNSLKHISQCLEDLKPIHDFPSIPVEKLDKCKGKTSYQSFLECTRDIENKWNTHLKSIQKGESCGKTLELIWNIRTNYRSILPKVKDSDLPSDLREHEYKRHHKVVMAIDKYLKSAPAATSEKQVASKQREDATSTEISGSVESMSKTSQSSSETDGSETKGNGMDEYRVKVFEFIDEIKKSNRGILKKVKDSDLPSHLQDSEYKKHYRYLMSIDNYFKSTAVAIEVKQGPSKENQTLEDSTTKTTKRIGSVESIRKTSKDSENSGTKPSIEVGIQTEPLVVTMSTETDRNEERNLQNYNRLLEEIWSLKTENKHALKKPDESDIPEELLNSECSKHFKVLIAVKNVLKSIHSQEAEIQELIKTIKDLKAKLESKDLEVKTSQHDCEIILKETDGLHEHQSKIEKEKDVLHRENERLLNLLKKPENDIKQKYRQLLPEHRKLEKEKDELQKRCKEYESNFKQLTAQKQRVERPQTAPASSERYLKELQCTIETLKGEKESLMQRLSMVAGRKMKDNNPAIADLSDPNRPERLTEQFREIYDNAWTDVLDCLTENEKVKDEVAVKQIVDVLQAIFQQCKCQIEKRKQTIIKLIGYPEDTLEKQYTGGKDGHDPTVKIIKDLVQGSAGRIWEDVIQEIKKTPVVTEILETGEEKSDIFVTKCSHLCLYMAVQDPPVVLDFSCKPGDPFNKDLLTPFTSSGDIVDYLVWPVTYLSQSGAIMSKGIAQGKKTIAKKQNEDN